MSINVELLKEICEVSGVPGYEDRIREVVLREVAPLVDSIRVDNMGNVHAVKEGRGDNKVMVAAHMDEIGFIVKYIDDNGFIFFSTLGGFDPKTLTAQRVIIHGKEDVIGVMGSKPIHIMEPEERNRAPQLKDYYIDTGLSRKEVLKKIFIGAPISRQRELIEMGNMVNCKSIDNRVSVFVLIEALRRLTEAAYEVHAVFTVQEEVGLRGAMVAAHNIDPGFAICLDTTIAYDLPGAKPEEMVTKLGEGTAIKILDAMTICDRRMVAYLQDLAEQKNIKWQPEILVAGGTDTAGMQRMSTQGCIAGAISIPTRHIHQVIEMASKSDIQNSIDLLIAALTEMDHYNWSF